MVAVNIRAQPMSASLVISSPRNSTPASAPNADSSERIIDAPAGLTPLCPTICSV